jgi:hypothetical protein
MDNENTHAQALETYFSQCQEVANRMRQQMKLLSDNQESMLKAIQPLNDFHDSFQKAVQPILTAQERMRQITESVCLPQIAIPRIPLIAEHIFDFQKAIQDAINPAFLKLQTGFEDLPKRTQDVLLQLGQLGWYVDPEMSLPVLWDLNEAIKNGDIQGAEAALVAYFEKRVTEIEQSVSAKFPHRGHLIRSAFEAHRREEFDLSVPVLFAQADGICKETIDHYLFTSQDKKPSTAIYVQQIAADTYSAALLSPLANTLPINVSEKQRPAGFSSLNRHMVLHGESLDYGNRTNSLKAISLINYVSYVLPVENAVTDISREP